MQYVRSIIKLVILFIWFLAIVVTVKSIISFMSPDKCAKAFMNNIAEDNFIKAHSFVYKDCNGKFTYDFAQQAEEDYAAYKGFVSLDKFDVKSIKYNKKRNAAFVKANMTVTNVTYKPTRVLKNEVNLYLIKKGVRWLVYSCSDFEE